MKTILAIALGGAVGAVLRHGVNNAAMSAFGTHFPWGIMIANVLGSFILGCLVTCFANFWDVPHLWRTFIVVGGLGAFTTFSTFSLDGVLMLERGDYAQAAFYVMGSVVLGMAALAGGMALVRSLVPLS